MDNYTLKDKQKVLEKHEQHDLTVAVYGEDMYALECEDCNEVLHSWEESDNYSTQSLEYLENKLEQHVGHEILVFLEEEENVLTCDTCSEELIEWSDKNE